MSNKLLTSSAAMLASTLILVGCQNTTSLEHLKKAKTTVSVEETSMTGSDKSATEAKITPEVLSRYHWTLVSAADNNNQPVAELERLNTAEQEATLAFTLNALSPSVGCNQMSVGYEVTNNVLQTKGQMTSTLMGCGDMQPAESKLASLVAGTSQLVLNDGAAPTLTQITDDKVTLIWQGEMTAQAKYGQEGKTLFWAVDHEPQPCPDGTITCLKVKTISYDEQGIKSDEGDWRLFSGRIQGFTHDDSQDQVVRLKRYVIDPSDVKGKQIIYMLDTVIESQSVE